MSITSSVNSLSTIYMVGKAVWNVFNVDSRPFVFESSSEDGYRPSAWADYGTDEAQMLYLAPNIAETKSQESADGQEGETTVGYFFDAFLNEQHTNMVRITEHPIQGGANISDHAYNLPDVLKLTVFASDSMQSIVTNQFKEFDTKSESVYEVLRRLKEKRVLVSVRTRLRYYENMLIESINIDDTYKTAHSVKCHVSLKQILMATYVMEYVRRDKKSVAVETNSGPQQATGTDGSRLHTMTYKSGK